MDRPRPLVIALLAALLAAPATAADPPKPAAKGASPDKLDYRKDVPRLEAEVRRGDANSAEMLGEIYEAGLGVPRNPERGCDLFEQAAAKGLPEAEHNFANCWFWGVGRSRDYKRAADWYQRAIGHGFLRSYCALGAQYRHGLGVPVDKEKAFKLCSDGAEQGDPDTLSELGSMYLAGDGVARDYKKARDFLQRAADQNQTNAARLLGLMYFNGDGVTRDPNQARDWLMRAADGGRRDAFLPLGKLFADAAGDVAKKPIVEGIVLPALFWLQLAAEYDPLPERRAEATEIYAPLAAAAPALVKKLEPELKPWRTSLGKP